MVDINQALPKTEIEVYDSYQNTGTYNSSVNFAFSFKIFILIFLAGYSFFGWIETPAKALRYSKNQEAQNS